MPSIGQSLPRVDAFAKVTGQAAYTADLEPADVWYAKIIRSTVANGRVEGFRLDEARAVDGVEAIFTCFDVPDRPFPTPGHPWSTEPAHQDIADRLLLNTRVRMFGDEIAVVVARDRLSAERAARKIEADYTVWPPLRTPFEAMAAQTPPLHDEKPDNILAHSSFRLGEHTFDEAAAQPGAVVVSAHYRVPPVQHCHLEPVHSVAWMEDDRIVVMTSTQIPHIVRRVVGQALGVPWSRVRIIKPYIGGGFGNKQDVLVEPLAAWLTTQLGGHPVKIELTREEVLGCTRVRHPFDWEVSAAALPDGTLLARRYQAWSNQGAYASHAHAIAANAANVFKQCYRDRMALESDSWTVYTNCITAGAMRGYGIPQGCFVTECLTDDLAHALGLDPLRFRLQNCVQAGYRDPHNGITMHSYGLAECLRRGAEAIGWDEKRAAYAHQTGAVRRGVGMALFTYKTGVYPISLETAACRMVLHQDGGLTVQMGAAEIGQGADTVFTQMAAEAVGVTPDRVHIQSTQDTDLSPFDTGAYASRQTYVSGLACKKTGKVLRARILEYAGWLLSCDPGTLDLRDNTIVCRDTGEALCPLETVAMESCYNLKKTVHLAAEETYHCDHNTFATGACFAEIEVDLPLGRITIRRLLNVHDSGRLINPALARAQVHGGMSMGLGYALSEELLYDDKGRPRNANLLDYKMPTAADTPALEALFVELDDPTGPYGNKALGEPPAIPVAPAIRNALLHATGVAVNELPLSPQRLVEAFTRAGLIGGADDV